MKKSSLPEASRPSRAPKAKDRVREASRGERDVRLSVDIPEELRRRLKGEASYKGLSIRDYIVALLEKDLPKRHV